MKSKTNKLTAPIAMAFVALLMGSAANAATLKISPKGEQLLFDQLSSLLIIPQGCSITGC
jgi:hypothetical protein